MPAERPADAPPRVVAARDDGKAEKGKADKAEADNEAKKPAPAAHRTARLGVRGKQN
jgi:hypothetical protein